ncbi:MAG TPA: YtxH domain-containing protein [Puia sp.]|nr:YtxH domain-containing protein [Puia sp.]
MSGSKTFLVFLMGMAAGVATGILVAPRRGDKTRKKLAKHARAFSGQLLNKATKVGEQLKDSYESAKDGVSKSLNIS